jgi:hypothetical protein
VHGVEHGEEAFARYAESLRGALGEQTRDEYLAAGA